MYPVWFVRQDGDLLFLNSAILRFSLDIASKSFRFSGKLQSPGADDEMDVNVAFQVTTESMKNLGIAGKMP